MYHVVVSLLEGFGVKLEGGVGFVEVFLGGVACGGVGRFLCVG